MLKVQDLHVGYGDVPALMGVSLEVPEATIVAVVGANAAGKSTMIKAISGQLAVRGGSILLDGQRLDTLPAHRRVQAGVIHVPEGRRVFPYMTVKENLLLGAYAPNARKRLARSLEHVYEILPTLKDRSGQMAGSLSGGQQQMLAVGRGLMACPRLIMLDEPSLGLAPVIARQVFRLVKQIRAEGTTVLLVEQNVRHSLAVADHAYVLENGRVVRSGPAAELAADPAVQAAYMGV